MNNLDLGLDFCIFSIECKMILSIFYLYKYVHLLNYTLNVCTVWRLRQWKGYNISVAKITTQKLYCSAQYVSPNKISA